MATATNAHSLRRAPGGACPEVATHRWRGPARRLDFVTRLRLLQSWRLSSRRAGRSLNRACSGAHGIRGAEGGKTGAEARWTQKMDARRGFRRLTLSLGPALAIGVAAGVASAAGGVAEGPRLAYLDPGSGSFILQALVAMLAGAVVAINAY